jgi:hypothetical protein
MCETCRSIHQVELDGEICVHFPGLKNLQIARLFVFPKLAVCLNCGNAKFKIPETELRLIRRTCRTFPVAGEPKQGVTGGTALLIGP